jgi:hypothetical protein
MRAACFAAFLAAVSCTGGPHYVGIDADTDVDAPNADASSDGGIDAPTDAPMAATCSDYCATIQTNCTGANLMYGGTTTCMDVCAKFSAGTVGSTTGNSLECRYYHSGLAAGGGANTHCRHAGPGGDNQCGADCEGFCTIVLASCTGANQQYGGSLSSCMSACAGYATSPAYVSGASGNNLACRLYHATIAATASMASTHCPHTAMTSAVCQ